MIPILVICHNNYKYVRNTLDQIKAINPEYHQTIQIVDNASTCPETIEFLKTVGVPVIRNDNNGPWITPWINVHIYHALPDKFILTDPDLGFNPNLPRDFVDQLSLLSDTYEANRIGFALDISDFDKMFQEAYHNGVTVYDHEKQFWSNRIVNDRYEMYLADLDTTFNLLNKRFVDRCTSIRVAGAFTAKHLPWYIDNPVYTPYENYEASTRVQKYSTTAKHIAEYIENRYVRIFKNSQSFLIENNHNNPNLSFWKETYPYWEIETFNVFDAFLREDKIFIDIGGWIGTTAMYASRKSRHVYSIEADRLSFNDLGVNMKTNCVQNYTLVNKAIYNTDNTSIRFGKNKFIDNSKMNDSTSQIYNDDETSEDSYIVDTITLTRLIETYNINPWEISLIKVDIEGGEEYILEEVFKIHKTYNIPVYLSFHHMWWNNKDLNRFDFLSETDKDRILKDSLVSILFNT